MDSCHLLIQGRSTIWPPFPGSSVFYLSWNSLINIKKKCCYSSHLKKKSFFQHHVPYQLLPPVFALFSAKLAEGVAYTHYLWFFSCFLWSPIQCGFSPSLQHQNSHYQVPYDLFTVKSNGQFPVLLFLGWLAVFSWSLPPPYSICLPGNCSCFPPASWLVPSQYPLQIPLLLKEPRAQPCSSSFLSSTPSFGDPIQFHGFMLQIPNFHLQNRPSA